MAGDICDGFNFLMLIRDGDTEGNISCGFAA